MSDKADKSRSILRFAPHSDPQIVGNARRGEVTDEHVSLARSAAASARKGELKKISLWSKVQDKPRLHKCRLLVSGAIGQIHTHQCGWVSSFLLPGADDRTERRSGRMTTLEWFAVGGSRSRGVQRCK